MSAGHSRTGECYRYWGDRPRQGNHPAVHGSRVHAPAQNANSILRGNTDLANPLEEDIYVPIILLLYAYFCFHDGPFPQDEFQEMELLSQIGTFFKALELYCQ